MSSAPSRMSSSTCVRSNGSNVDSPENRKPVRHSRGPKPRTIWALEHVRRMRGGAQSQLLMCADGKRYVVKFQNNPQGRRILVNELLCFILADHLGLPTQPSRVIDLSPGLIRRSRHQMMVETATGRASLVAGRCFGSEYAESGIATIELQTRLNVNEIENVRDFWGILTFDLWTCNTDLRQVLYFKSGNRYRMRMIDNGHCFSGSKWGFVDAPGLALFWNRGVYKDVAGIESFQPWLSRIESIDNSILEQAVALIPPEWYGARREAIEGLLRSLMSRRFQVRDQLLWLRRQNPLLFPRWRVTPEPAIAWQTADVPVLLHQQIIALDESD